MSFWQIWAVALLIKVIMLPVLPITPDEAYYFAWSRHLSLSYFDHPPLIAWIMWLAQPLWKSPFGVRLPAVIIGHLSIIPFALGLQRLGFSKRALILWLMASLLGPLTGFGSIIATPDIPFMFFWSLSFYFYVLCLQDSDWRHWTFLGAALGFALLSKYMAVLFFLCVLTHIVTTNRIYLLKTLGPWLGLVTSVLVFLPVVIWNKENEWASFNFQLNHGLGGSDFRLKYFFEYVSAQLGLLNPFLVLVVFSSGAYFLKKQRLLLAFAFVPLFFFAFSSLKSRVEANWPLAAYPSMMALAALAFEQHSRQSWVQKTWKVGLAMATVFGVGVLTHAIRPWLPIPPGKDHSRQLHEWKQDLIELQGVAPLYARTYQMAAYYSYYREPENEVFKIKGINRPDHYDHLPQSQPSQPFYAVLKENDLIPESVDQRFVKAFVKPLPSGYGLYRFNLK
ncbi:MAG: glycosyltransferase family 39 protein [Oligoflexia bacterium]|nr:glycosyltransferase family 39 protein [Oligoflexia bacterium]